MPIGFPTTSKTRQQSVPFSISHFLHIAYHPTKQSQHICKSKSIRRLSIYFLSFYSLCLSRSLSNWIAVQFTYTYRLQLSVHSPAYLWHEGSACSPYRPPTVEALVWCFQFHPGAGGRACARCLLSTASSTRPFCSGAASYKTGGSPSPAGKRELKS